MPLSDSTGKEHERVVEFKSVGFSAGDHRILEDVSFALDSGEVLVLLGRSGSGKTTALKLVNRLLLPSSGEVVVSGRSTQSWDAIALRRSIGWVIQETGLFPHYSVEKNVATVPRLLGWSSERIDARIDELMRLVGLESHLRSRYPHQLSGGQRQRVGVARALASDPQILLMDEPFGALDPITRSELQRQFRALQQQLRTTVILVTHDVREALMLGTRIALLERGRVVTISPREEFATSTDPQVREYLSSVGEVPALASLFKQG